MHLALPVNAQALDNLIDAVTSAHSTVIMRHSSRDFDTQESHIDTVMAVPRIPGVSATRGTFQRADFEHAAYSAAVSLADEAMLGSFARGWLDGTIDADAAIPEAFAMAVALIVFDN